MAINVDAEAALEDQPVHVTLSGLQRGQEVTVSAQTSDAQNQQWSSHALFRADAHGRVSLDAAAPLSGSYHGVDGMGLFWSMDPAQGNPDLATLYPPAGRSFSVTLMAVVDGHEVARKQLTRSWAAQGVSVRKLTVAADHVAGELFLPPPSASRRTAVLAFGGSEGGDSAVSEAALLASHGYPCLALGYFGMPGLPRSLNNIPLEYFATAARLLGAQPDVDPAHILALGYSRGSEAALLLADHYPDLVHGAVLYSPSAEVHAGYPNPGTQAWTWNGRPVASGPIPVNQIDGPVLTVGGADDLVWEGDVWARQIVQELNVDRDPYPHQALVYPNAGHQVGSFPYESVGTNPSHSVTGEGGTRPGNEAGKLASWQQLLAFLAADHQ